MYAYKPTQAHTYVWRGEKGERWLCVYSVIPALGLLLEFSSLIPSKTVKVHDILEPFNVTHSFYGCSNETGDVEWLFTMTQLCVE